MEKRDITGKKYYKELFVKPVRQNISHYCFIAIRTTLEPLDFFAGIYQHSNFLFSLSKHTLDVVIDSNSFSFQSFEFQDPLSEYIAFCLVNKSLHKDQYLLGIKDYNSCHLLQERQKQKQKQHKNQLSFSFQDNDDYEINEDGEENDWNSFKQNIQNTSVNLMGKIDYIFPVFIRTYEILKPLFLHFKNITSLNYMLVDPKNINDIELFFSQLNFHTDKLNEKVENKNSF